MLLLVYKHDFKRGALLLFLHFFFPQEFAPKWMCLRMCKNFLLFHLCFCNSCIWPAPLCVSTWRNRYTCFILTCRPFYQMSWYHLVCTWLAQVSGLHLPLQQVPSDFIVSACFAGPYFLTLVKALLKKALKPLLKRNIFLRFCTN